MGFSVDFNHLSLLHKSPILPTLEPKLGVKEKQIRRQAPRKQPAASAMPVLLSHWPALFTFQHPQAAASILCLELSVTGVRLQEVIISLWSETQVYTHF